MNDSQGELLTTNTNIDKIGDISCKICYFV